MKPSRDVYPAGSCCLSGLGLAYFVGVEHQRLGRDPAVADDEVLHRTTGAEAAGCHFVHDHGSLVVAGGGEDVHRPRGLREWPTAWALSYGPLLHERPNHVARRDEFGPACSKERKGADAAKGLGGSPMLLVPGTRTCSRLPPIVMVPVAEMPARHMALSAVLDQHTAARSRLPRCPKPCSAGTACCRPRRRRRSERAGHDLRRLGGRVLLRRRPQRHSLHEVDRREEAGKTASAHPVSTGGGLHCDPAGLPGVAIARRGAFRTVPRRSAWKIGAEHQARPPATSDALARAGRLSRFYMRVRAARGTCRRRSPG
jgi:hypothetical protein